MADDERREMIKTNGAGEYHETASVSKHTITNNGGHLKCEDCKKEMRKNSNYYNTKTVKNGNMSGLYTRCEDCFLNEVIKFINYGLKDGEKSLWLLDRVKK